MAVSNRGKPPSRGRGQAAPRQRRFQILLHPEQDRFLNSTARYRGFVGGRGSGKSFIGAYDMLTKACSRQNRLYMVVAPTYGVLRDTSIRTFLDLAERTGKLATYNKTDFRATLDSRSEVVFRSAEDPERLRGPNISGLWFDEAQGTSLAAFEIAIACLREDPDWNWCTSTFTPRGRQHWTYDKFAKLGTDGAPPPDTELFHCSTADNPFLPENFEHDLRMQYTSEKSQQELEGAFVDFSGTLFKRDWFAGQIVKAAPVSGRRVRYWDKACLVQGTLITTSSGQVPIEQVRAGDQVLTRAGYRKVLKAWQTKEVSAVVSVLFSNGTVVTGTADHLVWTENRGWVELASLKHTDYAVGLARFSDGGQSWHGEEANHYQTLRLFSLQGSAFAGGPGSVISRASDSCQAVATSPTFCTGPSGGTTTAIFPLATTYTTSTGTSTTTTYPTLNALLTASTCAGTGNPGSPTRRSSGEWWPGRPRRKASKFYAGTAALSGRVSSPRRTSAAAVEFLSSRVASLAGHSTVQPGAAKLTTGTWVAGLASAKNPRIPVYDLEVEGEHEFFANGVLVHNSTRDGGCYTAGVLMVADQPGHYYIENVIRGQWSTHQRDEIIALTAQLDQERHGYGAVRIYIEQEPGSGGVDSLNSTIKQLAGHIVHGDRPTGQKRVRAEPFAAQCEARNVFLVADEQFPWIQEYIDELCLFPDGKFSDQVDASSGGFNQLIKGVYAYPVAGGGTLGNPTPGTASGYQQLLQGLSGLPSPQGGAYLGGGMAPGSSDLHNFRPR